MSANDVVFDDSTVDDEVRGSDGFKSLRTAYDKAVKDLRAANETASRLTAERRSNTLARVLSDKGVNPKAARFYPADSEADEASVTKWLDENAELFPASPPPGQGTPPAAGEDDSSADQARRIAQVSGSAAANQPGAGGLDDSVAKLGRLDVKSPTFLADLSGVMTAATS
jgi:hypothetical protein